jgi:hypothetical protein
METHRDAGSPQSDYIAEPWERDAKGFLATNVRTKLYYLLATREEYKYMQCGIKMKGMRMYYDNMQNEETTALYFPSFKHGDRIQKFVASMPDALALEEWELHTLENMKSNDNHQSSIKYWSRDIIKSMRWLMQQPAYAEHHIYAPQHCFNSDTVLKHLYTEMHTADW